MAVSFWSLMYSRVGIRHILLPVLALITFFLPVNARAARMAAITLSVPTRYVHSVVETLNVKDLQAAADLLAAFLQDPEPLDG